MSISSISGGQAALLALLSPPGVASAGVVAGSGEDGLIANVEAAASGVGAALQGISGAIGSIIDVSA